MQHLRQKYAVDCGATAYRQIVNHVKPYISHAEAILDCKTNSKGTSTDNVCAALKKRGISYYRLILNQDFKVLITDLKLKSNHYPIFAAAEFRSGGGRGRDHVRHHAFSIFNGQIHDPACNEAFPINSYFHTYNKKLIINEILIIGLDN